MADIVEFAPAKINLALHVTGQRADGYHLIESIVVFAQAGDRLSVSAAQTDSFGVDGPFADALSGENDNLVLRAREAMRAVVAGAGPTDIRLEKHLPVAAGIGGGSADAAACLRALRRLWSAPLSDAELHAIAARLGADVPMCLQSRPLVATGIGDVVEPVSTLPPMPIVLVNPNVAVSTPEIFKRLTDKNNPGIALTADNAAEGWVAALQTLRNDLQPPAEALFPDITDCRSALTDSGAAIARMSGSGATCFGLFADGQKAAAAAAAIRNAHPAWYVCATVTLAG